MTLPMKNLLFVFAALVIGVRAQPVGDDRHAAIEASYREMMNAAQSGDFTKARSLCQQAMAAEPREPKHRYNFACIEAIIARKEIDLSLTALEQAVTLGFNNSGALQADPDLASLRSDPRFDSLVAAAERNAAAVPANATTPATTPVVREAQVPRAVAQMTEAEKPAPASFRSGSPVGLYFMTRYWSYTHTLEKAAWYFAPDGAVYENLDHGFSSADLAAHAGRKGRAHFDGGKLSVTWVNGQKAESNVERDGTGFAWDMGSFTPVQPITNAAAVAGVYEGGESLSHGGNQVAVSKRLELHADGTFSWEGISFVSGDTAATKLYAGANGGTAGSWQADAYSIALTDADGRVFRAIAFPYSVGETAGPSDHLFFAGIMYKRL